MNGFKSLASGKSFWSLFGEKNFTVKKSMCVENFLYWKTVLIVENFFCEENFLVCGKAPWLWKRSRKIFLTVENFLRCGNYPWSRKISLIKENLLSWLQKNIMDLIILKRNASVETIKTYLLNLEQKRSLLVYFAVDETDIIFSQRGKHKYRPFNVWQ